MIDENDDTSKINFYIEMMQKTDQGEHITLDNPFDRSISIAFELVIQQHLNPWDIDLVKFSSMYLRRTQEEKINLMTAGRMIYMAWKILKMQSSELVVNMEAKKEEYEPFEWSDLPSEMWMKDDDYSYTNLLLHVVDPPIEEPLRRDAKRKVTLIELLDAFNQARKDSEDYQLNEKQRNEEKNRLWEKARKRMKGTAHEDHLEEDIMALWDKIKRINKETVSLFELCDFNSRDELIKVFMSVLFLANEGKIHIFQKRFPYGNIYVKNIENNVEYIIQSRVT